VNWGIYFFLQFWKYWCFKFIHVYSQIIHIPI